MKRKTGTWILWCISVAIALGIAVFQRTTGPTWTVRGAMEIDGSTVTYRFLRSSTAHEPLPVSVGTDQSGWNIVVEYRRHPSNEPWRQIVMLPVTSGYGAELPGQPPAGKLAYRVVVETTAGSTPLFEDPVIARFKGKVPLSWLLLHILFMLAGIIFCIRTGLESLRESPRLSRLVGLTLAVIALGGLLFGPMVQKFAFGDYWTGFPMGTDLTDNKTLLAIIFWLAAFFLKRRSRWWVFAAALLTITVYLIPHSLAGSELDYSTGGMKNKFSRSPVSIFVSPSPETGDG